MHFSILCYGRNLLYAPRARSHARRDGGQAAGQGHPDNGRDGELDGGRAHAVHTVGSHGQSHRLRLQAMAEVAKIRDRRTIQHRQQRR